MRMSRRIRRFCASGGHSGADEEEGEEDLGDSGRAELTSRRAASQERKTHRRSRPLRHLPSPSPVFRPSSSVHVFRARARARSDSGSDRIQNRARARARKTARRRGSGDGRRETKDGALADRRVPWLNTPPDDELKGRPSSSLRPRIAATLAALSAATASCAPGTLGQSAVDLTMTSAYRAPTNLLGRTALLRLARSSTALPAPRG